MDKIILAVDDDEAGYSLREELGRRLGVHRCFKVVYPEGCKDANEVLLKYGKQTVADMVENCVQFPLEGILGMEDMYEDVLNYFEHGYPSGIQVGIEGFDEYLQLMPGQISIVTGIPGSGKSEFVDYIMAKTSINHQWPWGVCSFENQPSSFHVTKLIEKVKGKAFAFRRNPQYRLSQDDFNHGCVFIDSYFYFININQVEITLTGILDKAAELVTRKGIKGLLIDPWNYIEHKIPKGYTETQYISESLTLIKSFALQYGVHIFVIAHPTKLMKDKGTGKYEVPNLYNISGSAHFFNKTDNGISVYRDFSTNQVDVYIQKVRYSWLGKVGQTSFMFNTETRQYQPITL